MQVHIVQIGSDDSVFQPVGYSDTLSRQLIYGRKLYEKHPQSLLSIIIHT